MNVWVILVTYIDRIIRNCDDVSNVNEAYKTLEEARTAVKKKFNDEYMEYNEFKYLDTVNQIIYELKEVTIY